MRPPAMAQLNGLVGEWHGTVRLHLQGQPDETSSLKSSFQWVLRDYHLHGTLQYTVGSRSYEALIIWSYNRDTKEYKTLWIHNFSSDAEIYHGTFHDGAFNLTSRYREGGKNIISSLHLAVDASRHWTMKVTSGPDGEVRTITAFTADRSKSK